MDAKSLRPPENRSHSPEFNHRMEKDQSLTALSASPFLTHLLRKLLPLVPQSLKLTESVLLPHNRSRLINTMTTCANHAQRQLRMNKVSRPRQPMDAVAEREPCALRETSHMWMLRPLQSKAQPSRPRRHARSPSLPLLHRLLVYRHQFHVLRSRCASPEDQKNESSTLGKVATALCYLVTENKAALCSVSKSWRRASEKSFGRIHRSHTI